MCKNKKRILFYSHDAYGMGNIRRTLAICNHLTNTVPNISILLLTGSPVIHSLRIPNGVDYIKLPCLTRNSSECFRAKYWDMSLSELIDIRSDLILSAVKSFNPDMVVVDKKPLGIKREFEPALTYLKQNLKTKVVLGLRDILDAPSVTVPIWKRNHYFDIIEDSYDAVWIYGAKDIFDTVEEYEMPDAVAAKAVFTGYLGRPQSERKRLEIRTELGLNGHVFSLVMVGGGGDGYSIMKTFVEGVKADHEKYHMDSLLLTGPEMPEEKRFALENDCRNGHPMRMKEFSDSVEDLLVAADVVVSMGGYNSTCEILSSKKKALIIPRVRPVKEQYIRTKRLAELGLVNMIHPDELNASALLQAIMETSNQSHLTENVDERIDLNGLFRIEQLTNEILGCYDEIRSYN